ncbi:MAG: DUF5615 family PIN-like protein [Acidobacteriota bacterium]
MRFLVDAQLPPALARWLASLGHQAEHVANRDLADASDSRIWQEAIELEAVLITKDEDFATLRTIRDSGPQIIWVRLRNCRKQALLDWFEPMLPRVLDALDKGEHLIELS